MSEVTVTEIGSVPPELSGELRLWIVDDGEYHWVAAEGPHIAERMVAESIEMTHEQYVSEHQPKTQLADYTKPCRIRLDSPADAVGLPAHTLYAEVAPGRFGEFDRGIVCASIW